MATPTFAMSALALVILLLVSWRTKIGKSIFHILFYMLMISHKFYFSLTLVVRRATKRIDPDATIGLLRMSPPYLHFRSN